MENRPLIEKFPPQRQVDYLLKEATVKMMEFPETNWTILAEATMNGGEQERHAMEDLCQAYWKPVAAYVASRGVYQERVDDLTQDFFLQIVRNRFFKKADRGKGRFRSFILTSLRYFLADDVKKQTAQKNGGHLSRAELYENSVTTQMDEAQFDRAWAEVIFHKSMAEVRREIEKSRGPKVWAVLKRFLPHRGTMPTYAELAKVMGIKEAGAKSEVFRLRQKFRSSLRHQVSLTVSFPHEVDEELAHLRAALASSPMVCQS